MTTLIAVYNGERCIGRCDAKCHNAKGPVCTCICGGKNHGVGLAQAMVNTGEITSSVLQEWAQKRVGADGDYAIRRQGLLFALEPSP